MRGLARAFAVFVLPSSVSRAEVRCRTLSCLAKPTENCAAAWSHTRSSSSKAWVMRGEHRARDGDERQSRRPVAISPVGVAQAGEQRTEGDADEALLLAECAQHDEGDHHHQPDGGAPAQVQALPVDREHVRQADLGHHGTPPDGSMTGSGDSPELRRAALTGGRSPLCERLRTLAGRDFPGWRGWCRTAERAVSPRHTERIAVFVVYRA